MKLSSILDSPIQRIIQSNSPDLISVSKYYSGLLIKFVKKVLQIIPISVFDNLQDIIKVLTQKMRKIPLKINRSELKTYAQWDQRKEIAKLTH